MKKQYFLAMVCFIVVLCGSFKFAFGKIINNCSMTFLSKSYAICNPIIENRSSDKVVIEFSAPVKMTKDSLFFSYRITNRTNMNYVFYNFHNLNNLISTVSESDYPKCNLYIIDEDNKLPSIEYVNTRSHRSAQPDGSKKYVELPGGVSKEFKRSFSIEGIVLKGDKFKFKLKYLPPRGEYFKSFNEDFLKEQNNNPALKDYILFDQTLETDLVPIELVNKPE